MSEDRGLYLVEKTQAQPLIRNCQFAFRCHQQWKSLEQTADPHIRYCHECSRSVVLCERDDELREALLADHCVAVPTGNGPTFTHTVGVLLPF